MKLINHIRVLLIHILNNPVIYAYFCLLVALPYCDNYYYLIVYYPDEKYKFSYLLFKTNFESDSRL